MGWDTTLRDGSEVTVLVTPGISGDVFHYDGSFADALALRNLDAEIRGLGGGSWSAWVGSQWRRIFGGLQGVAPIPLAEGEVFAVEAQGEAEEPEPAG